MESCAANWRNRIRAGQYIDPLPPLKCIIWPDAFDYDHAFLNAVENLYIYGQLPTIVAQGDPIIRHNTNFLRINGMHHDSWFVLPRRRRWRLGERGI